MKANPGMMVRLRLTALVALMSQSALSAQTGFDIGNDLKAVSLEGRVSVTCNDPVRGSSNASFFCTGEVLDPAEYARFTTDPGAGADRVTLRATHQDGSSRAKSASFNSSTGISTGRFNLWIRTLTQRPLLEPGTNKITYELTQSGRTVKTGEFTATVTSGGRRVCRPDYYSSPSMSDCEFGGPVCSRYFAQNNWCQ